MTAIGPQVRIRNLRLAYGLTIPALVTRIAEHGVEVDPNHISNVECGRKRASHALMTAWAKALGISPLDVLQPEPVAEVVRS